MIGALVWVWAGERVGVWVWFVCLKTAGPRASYITNAPYTP